MRFVYDQLPGRVIFGAGSSARVAEEIARLGLSRVAVLATPPQAETAQDFARMLGDRAALVFAGAAMHTPVEVTERAMAEITAKAVDGLLSVGGGSTIGLGKAIALRTDLPQVVVPTTYAGSEMTPILGQTEGGVKTTLRSNKVLPEVVIYDPDLTRTLPAAIAGPSGMNAIAHSVEALYAENANPITSMMAEESIRALGAALPVIVAGGEDGGAREDAVYGAWLAGACLGTVGMAIHHKICHTLGGSFDLPHADIHCLMIPYSAAYNRDHAPEAMARIARALGTGDAPTGLHDLMLKVAVKKSLAEFGLAAADLDRAADLAVTNPYYNPRPVDRAGVREMLQAAWEGRKP